MKKRLEHRAPGQLLWLVLAAWLLAFWPAHAETTFLEPEQAFRTSVTESGDGQATVRWAVAPGYYLYRDRLAVTGDGVGPVAWPAGERKQDPNFGAVEVYHSDVAVTVATGNARALQLSWQGCADAGLCYPPQQRTVALGAAAAGGSGPAGPAASPAASPSGVSGPGPGLQSDSEITRVLAQRSLLWTVPLFLLLGVALAFTPCALPMVPILSGIVVGQGAGPRRGLLLSLAFVAAMALVYAGLGVLAALAGSGLQALLQNAWTLLALAGLFTVLAFSMFGFYELQLPGFLRDRLASTAAAGGSLAGAATMGALSALLVGPCMTAPLAGTLLYIAQSGRVAEGALLLLALGLGMGVPLVVLSTLGARWLPRPGPWMNRVKGAFGFLLLGTAIWTAQRVLPAQVTLLLWGILLAALALSLWHLGAPAAAPDGQVAKRLLVRSGAAAAGLWGVAMVLGAAAGATDPARPLGAVLQRPQPATAAAAQGFEVIQDPALLQARLAAAAAAGRPALVEYSADWCTSCKTIEREVFGDARVGRALEGTVLLRADVTRGDAAQRAAMGRRQVMGPPTLLLFDASGQERRGDRLVGEFGADALLQRVATRSGRP